MRLLFVLRVSLPAATMLLGSLPRLVVRLFVVTVRLLRVSMRLLEVAALLLNAFVRLLMVVARLWSVPVGLFVATVLLLVFLLMLLLLILRPALGAVVVIKRVRLLRPDVALRAMIVVVAHGALGSHGVRMPAIVIGVEAAIGTRRLEMLLLKRSCADVPLVHCL